MMFCLLARMILSSPSLPHFPSHPHPFPGSPPSFPPRTRRRVSCTALLFWSFVLTRMPLLDPPSWRPTANTNTTMPFLSPRKYHRHHPMTPDPAKLPQPPPPKSWRENIQQITHQKRGEVPWSPRQAADAAHAAKTTGRLASKSFIDTFVHPGKSPSLPSSYHLM